MIRLCEHEHRFVKIAWDVLAKCMVRWAALDHKELDTPWNLHLMLSLPNLRWLYIYVFHCWPWASFEHMIMQIHRAALFDLWIFTNLYAPCALLVFTNSYALLIFAIWFFGSSLLIPKFVDKSQYFPSETLKTMPLILIWALSKRSNWPLDEVIVYWSLRMGIIKLCNLVDCVRSLPGCYRTQQIL